RIRNAVLILCAATGIAPAAKPSPASFSNAVVDAHNRAREKHCAPPLRWSSSLAASAQRWAHTLRSRGCALAHSEGRYGENLAGGTAGLLNPASVVAMWYDEGKHYSFSSGGFSMTTGHFTQLVWRATREVGCGRVQCREVDVWVCQYDPPGNVQGQYRENV